MIALYKGSPEFKSKALKTQKGYLQNLELISQWAGDAPVSALTRKLVRDWHRSMLATPHKANHAVSQLRILLQFGMNEGWVPDNAAARPGLVSVQPRQAFWQRDQMEALMAAADRAGKASIGTAVLLAWYLGQREDDILSLSWSSYDRERGTFRLRQSKTARWVEVPAARRLDRYATHGKPDEVKAALEAQLAAELGAKKVQYTRTDGSPFELTLAEVVSRAEAFEMTYNPNDCVELRWGAKAGSDEMSTCRAHAPADQRAKMESSRAWFRDRKRPPL